MNIGDHNRGTKITKVSSDNGERIGKHDLDEQAVSLHIRRLYR